MLCASLVTSACGFYPDETATAAERSKSAGALDPANELKSLWNMTKIRKTPLDVEIVSRKSEDGWIVEELYFTGEITPNGPNRLFCGYARPENAPCPVPVAIELHGGGGHGSGRQALSIARQLNAAVVSLDWSGEFIPGAEQFTKWRMDPANPYLHFAVERSLKDSPIYHIIVAARRAIDFVCEQPGIDSNRIAALGGSWGGYMSLLLAGIDGRIRYAASGMGAGGLRGSCSKIGSALVDLPTEKQDAWIAAFDPITYAPKSTAATLITACSNDWFFWLGDVMRNYRALRGSKAIAITPNCNHGVGGPSASDRTWVRWLRHCFHGEQPLPAVTGLKCEGRVYTWNVESPDPNVKSVLYWSPGQVVWPARYWIEIPATGKNGSWSAELPAKLAGVAAELYADAFDSNGGAASTELVTREGADPLVGSIPSWPAGALWDEERGAAAWRPPGPAKINGPLNVSLESPSAGKLTVGPAKGEKSFAVLTNSVVLTAGAARRHSGIRLRVDGLGHAGTMTVMLLKDSGSVREIAYSAVVDYGDNRATIDLRWDDFKGPAGPPYPFDGLRLDGSRPDGSALHIERIGYY